MDRKEAIRRDVYHMARLGLNAFRLHLWDLELTAGLHPRHPEFAVITLPPLAKDHPVNLTLRALLLYKKH